jgi:hypothetical protein
VVASLFATTSRRPAALLARRNVQVSPDPELEEIGR